jgi:hypothetical protein
MMARKTIEIEFTQQRPDPGMTNSNQGQIEAPNSEAHPERRLTYDTKCNKPLAGFIAGVMPSHGS